MACYHPLKGFPIGFTVSGKVQYKICSYKCDHVEIRSDGSAVPVLSRSVSPYAVKVVREFKPIPCGKCVGCRLAYSRQWADRCMLELNYHQDNWFLTLTYDDDHLPLAESVDDETGEIVRSATLVKRDLQLFMKRLRKNFPECDIRYFAAGEYGSQTYRPHYHMILYGCPIDDLKFYRRNLDSGYDYYNSETVDRIWKNGYVVIGNVTWDSCAYTARYIMKKQYGAAAEIYEKFNIQPEFTLMSRRPSIGRRYYDDHKDEIYQSDAIYVPMETGSLAVRPSKYYDRLFDLDEPEMMSDVKRQREEIAKSVSALKLKSTSQDYESMLESEEIVKMAQVSALKRKDF